MEKRAKTASKILILVQAIISWKSESRYNYFTHAAAQTSNSDISKKFGAIHLKTMHARNLKLWWYLLWQDSTKVTDEIFLCGHFMAKKLAELNMAASFLPNKWRTRKISKFYLPLLWRLTQERYHQSLKFLACMVSKRMVPKGFWDIAVWSSHAYSNCIVTHISKNHNFG